MLPKMASSTSSGIKRSTNSSSRLCQKCQNIVNRLDNIVYSNSIEFEALPFYDNASVVYSNAKNGCPLCGQILGIVENQEESISVLPEDIRISLEVRREYSHYTISGTCRQISIRNILPSFMIKAFPEQGQ